MTWLPSQCNMSNWFFFLVIAHEHFYLIHFLFTHHLEMYEHLKAAAISKAKPIILKLKWKTLNNRNDCGVFLMCHMDTYTGEPLSRWNPGFVTEAARGKVTQKLQLTKLRVKYLTKIVLHELNIHKAKMVAYVDEFAANNFDVGKDMINEAIKNRKKT